MDKKNIPDFITPLIVNTIIKEYQIIKCIGQGGFGTTYLCKDLNLNRNCIIKEYTPHSIAYRNKLNELNPIDFKSNWQFSDGLKDFLQEAQRLALFSHPNIVRINRFFQLHNTGYFVMDYEIGDSLRNVLIKRKTRFEEHEVEKIILPICAGLVQLHKNGLIHRDIKPENIIIRFDGTPLLIDFGAVGNLTSINFKDYKIYVTPYYAPIEQFSPDLPQGTWIDIYALGATLYELIAGNPPQHSLERLKNDKLIPITEIGRGNYGTRLLELIDRSLSLEYTSRPKNINEFLSFLKSDKYIFLRKVIHSTSIKATQHFLNFAVPNSGLYINEFTSFIIGFSILDLTWRLGKGRLMDNELFEKFLDLDLLETCKSLLLKSGFTSGTGILTLEMVRSRLEEYAATYLLDRQDEDWTYKMTRKQCSKNCLPPDFDKDKLEFEDLMEDVIDRYRGRIKKEMQKFYYK